MNKDNRASIFLSFDSLKGFKDIIKDQEMIYAPKKQLCEDELEILDWKIHHIETDMIIQITYWHQNRYVHKTGKVTRVSLDNQWIEIEKVRIPLKDIIEIQCDALDTIAMINE